MLTLLDTDGGGFSGGNGGDIDDLNIEGSWNTLMADLSAFIGCDVTLVVDFDSNADSEKLAIDAVSFSEGMLVAANCVSFDTPFSYCINEGIQIGVGGGEPIGGTYSGPGVTDDGNGMTFTFDPSAAGLGTTTITYMLESDECSGTRTAQVGVFASPSFSFTSSGSLCLNAGPTVVTPQLSIADPFTTGFFSGTGVTDNGDGLTYTFDPEVVGAGFFDVAFTLTDFRGCSTILTDGIQINEPPTVLFTAPADFDLDAAPQTNLDGGTPTGGTYSGPGVTDNGDGLTYTFDPAAAGAGTHAITYTFTAANGCSAGAVDEVTVFDPDSADDPLVGKASTLLVSPNPAVSTITFQLTSSGGLSQGSLLIYDVAGRQIDYYTGVQLPYTISVASFPTGLYTARWEPAAGGKQALRRFVVR
ncbi:MAG: hypothetical protein WBA17_10435 [Saprospiraceae bacterium]